MTRIFVGNLPTDISEKDVENEFGAYGTVNKVEVKHKRDPLTNNIMSTFAFVTITITDSLLNQCKFFELFFFTILVIDRFVCKACKSSKMKNFEEDS